MVNEMRGRNASPDAMDSASRRAELEAKIDQLLKESEKKLDRLSKIEEELFPGRKIKVRDRVIDEVHVLNTELLNAKKIDWQERKAKVLEEFNGRIPADDSELTAFERKYNFVKAVRKIEEELEEEIKMRNRDEARTDRDSFRQGKSINN